MHGYPCYGTYLGKIKRAYCLKVKGVEKNMELIIIILLVITCGLLTWLIFCVKSKDEEGSSELVSILQSELQKQINTVDTNVISRMSQNNESLIERFGKLQMAINNEMSINNEKLVMKFNEVGFESSF